MKVIKDWPITLGQKYNISFLEDDKVPKQIPFNENCKHSSTGWDLTTQVFQQIYIKTRVFLSEITWAHLLEPHN